MYNNTRIYTISKYITLEKLKTKLKIVSNSIRNDRIR